MAISKTGNTACPSTRLPAGRHAPHTVSWLFVCSTHCVQEFPPPLPPCGYLALNLTPRLQHSLSRQNLWPRATTPVTHCVYLALSLTPWLQRSLSVQCPQCSRITVCSTHLFYLPLCRTPRSSPHCEHSTHRVHTSPSAAPTMLPPTVSPWLQPSLSAEHAICPRITASITLCLPRTVTDTMASALTASTVPLVSTNY